MPSRRVLALLALALGCLVTLTLPAHWGRGSFDHALVALALNSIAASGTGVALVGVLLVRSLRRRRNAAPGCNRLLAACSTALALQLALGASFPLGRWLQERDLAHARRWCEAQLAFLDRVHRETGDYPEFLPATADSPRLFRTGDAAYRKLDRAFEFVLLPRSRSGRTGEALSSTDRRWLPRSEDEFAATTSIPR